jgi:hypothetical protein
MENQNGSILNEGVLCSFQVGYWGASAKLDKGNLGANVPKKIVRAMQDLFDDKLLIQDIMTVLRQAKYFVTSNSLPFPIDAVTFIPKHKITEINEGLQEYKAELKERVDRLVSKYDTLRNRFKRKYPDYYRPEKYPDKKRLRARYYMRWNFFQIGVPEAAAAVIDPEEYKREVNKFKGMVSEMEDLTINLIGNELLTRLDKLHTQCTTGEGLHGKTVNSINRLVEKWDDLWRGHVDDKKMKMIITRLRKEMKKVSIDRLKGNEHFRAEVGDKLGAMLKKLDKMPNVQLKRRLDI